LKLLLVECSAHFKKCPLSEREHEVFGAAPP
jgi:hypothetical protein